MIWQPHNLKGRRTIPYNTVQYQVQYRTVPYSTVQYRAVPDTVPYSTTCETLIKIAHPLRQCVKMIFSIVGRVHTPSDVLTEESRGTSRHLWDILLALATPRSQWL